jgi:hypothetical protein
MSTPDNHDRPDNHYRPCNACKKSIVFNAIHYVCSVSTCTRKRTGMVFCSVSCWETHVPVLRHRDAWAVEERAPSKEAWAKELAEDNEKPEKPAPRIITSSSAAASSSASGSSSSYSSAGASTSLSDDAPEDILIVASKLKQYIRARSGMNTSDGVMAALSDIVRSLCDEAIREAGRADRKTVMDRDFKKLG